MKHRNKKKFGRVFLRRFGICLLAAALLIGLYFRNGWKDCSRVEPGRMRSNFKDTTNLPDDGRLDRADRKGNLTRVLAALSDSGGYREMMFMLFQPETGEFYLPEPYAVIDVFQNGEMQFCRLTDPELIAKLKASLGSLLFYTDYIIYSIYVKDGAFLPGEVYMQKDSLISFYPPLQTEGRKIPGEWVDLSPENTEGWTKICSPRSKEYLASYHDEPDTVETDGQPHFAALSVIGCVEPHAAAVREKLRAEFPEQYQEMMKEQEQILANLENEEAFEDLSARYGTADKEDIRTRIQAEQKTERRKLPLNICESYQAAVFQTNYNSEAEVEDYSFRGGTWSLLRWQHYDPVKLFRLQYLMFWPLMIIPSLILAAAAALIWALIAYLFYSRRYDLAEYRRNLTGALAHDLKTPLAVIHGNAENIRAHTHPEHTDEYADCIMENVQHMDSMIAGVLGLAELEDGTRPEMKETVDLTALLHAAFQRNEAMLFVRGLKLKESGKLEVRGNAEMLTQLAENLAANAVQHAAEGGTITVTAEKNTLRISNPFTGTLDAKTLCEPFRRGSAARGSEAGSGLGLSFVRQIASLHRLRLRITAKDGIFTAELRKRGSR